MKIFVPSIEIKDDEGFTPENDLFNREPFGKSLLNLINNTDDKLVIALDAPWGEGKTTFIKQWQGLLKNHDNPIDSIYFDAFENDYHKDAFLSLSRHIYQSIESTDKSSASKFKDSAMPILKKIATSGVKVAINAATLNILNNSILEGAGTGEEITNNIDKFLNNELTSLKADEEHLKNFKHTLQTLAESKSNKKIVFIIDELDRCNPKFSLQLLENIKHLFSVPNLVFLLVINRKQLEESIRCEYGQGVEATTYLQKFIHIWASLPISTDFNKSTSEIYIRDCLSKMGGQENFTNDLSSGRTLVDLSEHLNLTLRDIERSLSNFAILKNGLNSNIDTPHKILIPFFAILKAKFPDSYHRILTKSITYSELIKEIKIDSLSNTHFTSTHANHPVKWLLKYFLSSESVKSEMISEENPHFRGLDFYSHLIEEITETLNEFSLD